MQEQKRTLPAGNVKTKKPKQKKINKKDKNKRK